MILNTSIPFNTGRRVLRACVLEYNLPRFVYLMSMYILAEATRLRRASTAMANDIPTTAFLGVHGQPFSTPLYIQRHMYLPGALVCLCSNGSVYSLPQLPPPPGQQRYLYTEGNPGPLLCILVCVTLFDTLYACNCTLYVDKVLCGCIQLVR